jgi:hypothetical protein
MSALTIEDAKFVIKHWRLTAHHQEAAMLILEKFEGLQKEAGRLLDEIERLQPPTDSRGIIPVGEHVKALGEKDREIGELRRQVKTLEFRLSAQTLYGATAPKDRLGAAQQAARNIENREGQVFLDNGGQG